MSGDVPVLSPLHSSATVGWVLRPWWSKNAATRFTHAGNESGDTTHPSGIEIKMNIRLSRRGAASPLWIAALGWTMLGALVAGCQPRSATLLSAGTQRAQFAVSFDTPAFAAPQAPFDETPITWIETVGAAAGE